MFFNDANFLHITNIHINEKGINEYFPISKDYIEFDLLSYNVFSINYY